MEFKVKRGCPSVASVFTALDIWHAMLGAGDTSSRLKVLLACSGKPSGSLSRGVTTSGLGSLLSGIFTSGLLMLRLSRDACGDVCGDDVNEQTVMSSDS